MIEIKSERKRRMKRRKEDVAEWEDKEVREKKVAGYEAVCLRSEWKKDEKKAKGERKKGREWERKKRKKKIAKE